MIIPVKCFTCGKVLANKYMWYLRKVKYLKMENKDNTNNILYLTKDNLEKTAESIVMDKLQLNRMCCRRHMLTHVSIE